MIGSSEFPRLTATNHRVTSDATSDYNCLAWAAGDTQHWWQPGVYWPVAASIADLSLDTLAAAFASLGFVPCDTGDLDDGDEKIALYGSQQVYTHAARQLPTGKWTSKLGRDVDIEHENAEDVAGGIYGDLHGFMTRAKNPSS